MKKVLVLLAMVLGATNMFAQNLTEKFIMGQLPTTAEDFQKYQFDYKLECAQDVGYDYDVYIPQNAFDGTNIFPLERNEVLIKSIECTVANSNSVLFRLKADFTSSGKVNNYLRKVGADAKYQFGTDTWYQKEWTSVGLTPCVPNSFACWTSPTRNSKGLIVSVSADLKYKYDSNDRVIEVRYHDNEFVYRYSYEGNSKRISNISVSYRNKEVATANYTWLNDRISKLYCHIDYTSKFSNMFDEYEKSYKYDSHNNVSVIEYREIHGSQWNRKIYEFNNKYDAKGQLVSQNVVLRKTRAWDVERGKPEEVKTHTRSYTYDEKGNWVRMIESQGSAQWSMDRKITYSNKKVGEADINNIYDDEEVETHATFGSTIREALRKNGLSYDGNLWPYLGNLVINFRFVVARDGSVHVYDEAHTNKPNIEGAISKEVSDYIKSLPWTPATINGTFVNSTVLVSWKYNKTENSYSTEILKDVVYTDNEAKQFANFHRMKKEQEEAASSSTSQKTDGGTTTVTETKSLREGEGQSEKVIYGHKAVDLGLSVYWAESNIDASSIEDYGDYYSWGETYSKNTYSPNNYLYYKNGSFENIGTDIAKTSYDAAHVRWGSPWRMPTKEEFEELIRECQWSWTTHNGVKGYKVQGANGNSIFLPSAGQTRNSSRHWTGERGYYWTSTVGKTSRYAYYLVFAPFVGNGVLGTETDNGYDFRCWGYVIRPVLDRKR